MAFLIEDGEFVLDDVTDEFIIVDNPEDCECCGADPPPTNCFCADTDPPDVYNSIQLEISGLPATVNETRHSYTEGTNNYVLGTLELNGLDALNGTYVGSLNAECPDAPAPVPACPFDDPRWGKCYYTLPFTCVDLTGSVRVQAELFPYAPTDNTYDIVGKARIVVGAGQAVGILGDILYVLDNGPTFIYRYYWAKLPFVFNSIGLNFNYDSNTYSPINYQYYRDTLCTPFGKLDDGSMPPSFLHNFFYGGFFYRSPGYPPGPSCTDGSITLPRATCERLPFTEGDYSLPACSGSWRSTPASPYVIDHDLSAIGFVVNWVTS